MSGASSANCPRKGTWTGLHLDPKNTSHWIWSDGQHLTYRKWSAKAKKSRYQDDKNCTELRPAKSVFWYKNLCSQNNCYVCEKGKLVRGGFTVVVLQEWTSTMFSFPYPNISPQPPPPQEKVIRDACLHFQNYPLKGANQTMNSNWPLKYDTSSYPTKWQWNAITPLSRESDSIRVSITYSWVVLHAWKVTLDKLYTSMLSNLLIYRGEF